MLISVIVPIYKVEKYIRCCVDSLISQTLKEIEIILVDDSSPDNCGKICDDYASKYSNIKVIHKKNEGVSVARNTGLQHSTGEFVCFVDSDDYVTPDFCETLYNLLKGNNCDFSSCRFVRFLDDEEPVISDEKETFHWTNYKFLEQQLNHQTTFCVWNKMYRRSSIEKLRFKEGKLHEDLIWSVDLARSCTNGVVETRKQCYFYRQRQNSIMYESNLSCSPDFVYAGKHIMDIVRNNKPDLYDDSLAYTVAYPWLFVDKIYLKRTFSDNRQLLGDLRHLMKDNITGIKQSKHFSDISKSRMKLFCKSRILYGFNVYARLLRVYIYRILKKDAQSDGHGI